MNKKAIVAVIGVLAITISTGALALGTSGRIFIDEDDEAGHASDAAVSADDAKAAAEEHTGGTAIAVELENEDGYLVYGVTIKDASGKTLDVKVDAGTGEVLKVDDGGDDGPEGSGVDEEAGPEASGEDEEGGLESDHEFDGEEEGEH